MAISGGFLEVRPDRVIVLADSAERAEEIDIARAEAAKKRAQDTLPIRLRNWKPPRLKRLYAALSLVLKWPIALKDAENNYII